MLENVSWPILKNEGDCSVEKREQVFVSSTYEDLKEARDTVIFGLLEADCFPAGMELFPASNASQWELIKTIIDDSDYYLLIIAGRYGSIDPSDGKSYTEKEFDYAVETGKPIVVFAHRDPGTLPANATDQDNVKKSKLDQFREKACTGRTVKFWTSKDELPGMAAMALNNLRKFNPAIGWVRGDQAMTPEQQAEFVALRARIAELELEKIERTIPSTELSQGSDEVNFTVRFKYWSTEHKRTYMDYEAVVTWNEIMINLGPMLLNEGSEADMEAKIDDIAIFFGRGQMGDRPADYSSTPEWVLQSPLASTVQVQFIALKLIERGTKPRVPSDRNDYWKLTRNGEEELISLRAIRKESAEVIVE